MNIIKTTLYKYNELDKETIKDFDIQPNETLRVQ